MGPWSAGPYHTGYYALLPVVELLCDEPTRWDLTYIILNRLRTLRQAVDDFLDDNDQRAIFHLKLEPVEWQILQDLEVVLEAPHAIQQSMSSESTPVLSCTIPAFERLVKKWKDLAQRFAHLAPFVAIGLTWTDKYHDRMNHTGAYGVAMFVDPAIRMSWMNDNWDMVRVNKARDYILELVRLFTLIKVQL
ncbi:ribonuclease H-like domain-containing protein [Suillus plorans]|uniref:Ribonuclease H-like domain-containing protein n=1 Tax=Suillus plorans TaxID=116603 RepID=A0A9P7AL71_9AGAM|nr:ribonuclease H-like domain-containing protein [Suillus plorans]KAG1791709.1 ribonuclease H-like domain-containing protein [Suillus plorans]